MHFNSAVGLVLGLTGAAAGLSIPKIPPSGVCTKKQYWDSGKGCVALPPPNKCSYGGWWDSLKGCQPGSPPHGPPFCTAVKGFVSAGGHQAQATSFCSSYLHVPLKTATSTATSFTTTVTITSTITSGVFITTDATEVITETDTATATESATVTGTTTSTTTISTVSTTSVTACASPVPVNKRSAQAIPKPGCLINYPAGPALSSACKCLSIKPSTTTTTTTLHKPTTTTVSVTVPHTQHATATDTATVVETDTITNTHTDTATVVETKYVYTSTTAVIAVPTFKVYAIGGDNNGNAFYDIGDGSIGDDSSGAFGTILNFSINSDGTLTVDNGSHSGQKGGADPNVGGSSALVYFNGAGNLQNIVCSLIDNNDGTCPLSCVSAHGSVSFDCGVYWRLASASDVGGCSQFTPYAVGSQ